MAEQRRFPDDYIEGLGRDYPHPATSHLYAGDFSDPGWPMCARGWNRDDGTAYSIWRGNTGRRGTCLVCIRRAIEGRDPVPPKDARQGAREGS